MSIKTKETPNDFFKINLTINFDDLFRFIDISGIKLYNYLSNDFDNLPNVEFYDELKVNDKNMISREKFQKKNVISIQTQDFEISDTLKNKIISKCYDDEFYELLGRELKIVILFNGDTYYSVGKCLSIKENLIKYKKEQNEEFERKIKELKQAHSNNEVEIHQLQIWDVG